MAVALITAVEVLLETPLTDASKAGWRNYYTATRNFLSQPENTKFASRER